ncbi:MAG: hypothetical protein COW19_10075 [Zetaproteobacteria bacterium CG12_big_fil_rev_8_21_14_0_65_55_1124]|nr:MAG: hypothetical protein AUJ58_07660 [Zetaproteobacteria bacterium CG1_02_55_237]PIS20080.1 MAG: hypothetical protein COT53_02525 [Zetaproteobacteria bacterium CG08_land_8_20_14_0_20_55_17]PIW42112.1 MAG: hypothetical protein COW19_10075 [Zetaproteobacteria bacterium CG12_big_fil_rev_8_21_14_0_65_55_1124]PIY52935.1 MAG: hypothetical protein COZ01_05870 [Zetaproteobacteria bacterium CG_4_10_14_0_8_um_filter_55_43]PIZ39563.1 MAG: hypothetical protein COY36_02605 [Zetaproteobacteria bacterium 
MIFKMMMFTVLAMALPLLASAESMETTKGTKLGKLECQTVPGSGTNLLIHSTVDVTCTFTSTAGEREHYKGETGVGLGVDLTFDKDSNFVFAVMAADFKKGEYKFAGKYFGAGADVTIGRGIGAGVLIGGSKKSVSLEPLGLSATKGAGVSGGLTYLYLEPDKAAD